MLACGGRRAWCKIGGNGGAFILRVGVPTCNVDSDHVVDDCELLIDVLKVLGACCCGGKPVLVIEAFVDGDCRHVQLVVG